VASLPKFWMPLCHERSVCFVSILFCRRHVIGQLTNLKVMFVGQRIIDSFDFRNGSKNLVAHLVHCRLYTGAVVLGEDLHGDVSRGLPCGIEVNRLGFGRILEELPLPTSLNVCAEDTVPGLGKLGILVTVKAVESGTGALQHQQLLYLGADRNALALPGDRLYHAELLAVTVERVWVWLAVNVHTGPSVLDDLDVCGMDVRIGRDEVVTNDGSKLLRRVNGVLFGEDVCGLLLGVGSHYD
jgi:hypothetical protein